jgi:hypothetical protein
MRAAFDSLGNKALAAEFMYWVAKYEAAIARVKHERSYWFYPLERISKTFHVSSRFAGAGLQALVDLGVMHVSYGRQDMTAPAGEFGRANRYYFDGFGAIARRKESFQELQDQYDEVFDVAHELSAELTNGRTFKNVQGLCELIVAAGEKTVQEVIGRLSGSQRRNPRRRLAYLRSVIPAPRAD